MGSIFLKRVKDLHQTIIETINGNNFDIPINIQLFPLHLSYVNMKLLIVLSKSIFIEIFISKNHPESDISSTMTSFKIENEFLH